MKYKTRQSSYSCKHCSETFHNPQLLGAHMRFQHPGMSKKKVKGGKVGRPRKTLVRVGKKKKAVDYLIEQAPTTMAETKPRYQFNHCPNCSCPLEGAREGLRTELEMRGQ